MKYVAVIEKAPDGSVSVCVPDLPGCVACADTVDQARRLIEQALASHAKSLRSHGEPVPTPGATTRAAHAA